jgi:hypothetical protein
MDRNKAKEYGSEGISEYQRFTPGSPKIVSALEAEHFMHGKVNTHRYLFEPEDETFDDPLYESIAEHGVEQPGMIWWDGKFGHIISGTRRWIRLAYSNARRLEVELPPRAMEFKINSRWSKAEAVQKWRRANQDRVDNDPLTRLEGAALEVEQGVAEDVAAQTWGLTIRQIKDAPLLLKASEDVRERVALGELALPAAFRLVRAYQSHDAQLAALAAPKSAKPKRKYLADDKRNELRAMLTGHLAGQPMNPERLGELLALL